MTTVLSSANPILSLLYEPETQLVIYALQQLNVLVDHYWAEIASAIPKIETLYEDRKFSERSLAAIVASKVFYHLDELDDALRYALGAGTLFDATSQQPDQYIQTIIQKSIDEYVRLRNLPSHDAEASKPIDPRLIAVIERLFDRCIDQREYRQVLGIAIESRRLDVVKRVIADSGNDQELLAYILELSNRVVVAKQFRTEVLQTLVALYRQHPSGKPDYISMCTCLQFLNDSKGVGEVLTQLVESDKDEDVLMAYQVAFDLQENQNQPFLDRVADVVPKPAAASNVTAASATATTATETTPLVSSTDTTSSSSSADAKLTKLRAILSGTTSTQLYLSFLYKHNATDLNILRQLKDKLEARNSVTHNAAVIAHGLMHVGTTVDTFLRENLEWLGKAQNWAKFTATASLGVIHKGHTSESLKLLEPYLPNAGSAAAAAPGGSGGSVYQEGGALFALGLIHGNAHTPTLTYLMEALRNAGSNEIVQHGACLGVGLAGMATQNRDVFEALKGIVMSESAVAGEAAGYAMGLVLLGGGTETAGDAIEEMLAYAHDTQHEKIIRGLAIGIALICYAQEEQADTTIEQLVSDKDGILRYGGCFAIALAYAGTSNNSAIQKLLHIAVTDVEDEVRRAAVTALGFVLANQPQQVPRVVQLLAESYNPHVRYGACMAVGIACAGGPASCRKEALDVLEPLLRDRVDLVRQAALIATSMVLIQHNEKSEPRLQTLLRKTITDTMAVKADTMTKLGAELATGIVDAGGRNVTLALLSQTGHKRMSAIAGMVLFTQFWYWYPLTHFLALSFTPTAVIGLNKDLNLPEPFSVISLAPPSTFAYPPLIDLNKEAVKKEVKHATLSVTDKAKRKAASKESGKMDVEEEKTPATDKPDSTDTAMKTEESKEGTTTTDKATKDDKTGKDQPEAKYQVLSNPARVTRDQEAKLHARPQQRYTPIKRHLGGIVLLKDTQPDKPEQLVKDAKPTTAVPGVGANEPAPPAPFEYRG